MLRRLTVENFVIVPRLELEFRPGFTVLTGETGAGKSILIDALALTLGARADASLVMPGRERAELSAEFETDGLAALRDWLAESALEGDEGVCILRRLVDAGGRSRAFVNGKSVTLQQLREAGAWLVDIVSQHAHHSLLLADTQQSLLDRYAGAQPLAEATAAAFRDWRRLVAERVAQAADQERLAAEREALGVRVRELGELRFDPADWDETNAEHHRLSNAAELLEGAQAALDLVSEGEAGALRQLNAALGRVSALTDYDPRLQEVVELLEPARIHLEEAAHSLRHYTRHTDLDPGRLERLEGRIREVQAAARKYRVTPGELPELLAAGRARLAALEESANLEALARREAAAQTAYHAAAGQLSAARKRAAAEFGERVSQALQSLAMRGARFEVALGAAREPNARGLEVVEFLVSPHASLPARPLAKVASGGELSRVSLAIQVVSGRLATVPTQVYDEVDVGIGGGVAQRVGEMLKRLGGERQVLCITHLPQVAAQGDTHWRVEKVAGTEAVTSRVVTLDAPARVEEVARMLGGAEITDTTRAHAAEMLNEAREPA